MERETGVTPPFLPARSPRVCYGAALPFRIMSAALQTFRHYKICQDRKGGTVEVWRSADEVACLAVDTTRGVFVELHVSITPPERQRDLRSFQNLVGLAAPLRHRHVLGVVEGGEDEGANYHVTDFLDGERLDTWLARCNPLPPWLALAVTRQVVEGLCALAPQPRLLAGVEPLHAGVSLAGPHTDELLVRLCDLGLAGPAPVVSEPRHVEARAIHETGRLLLYMLTGALTDAPVTAAELTERKVPPELGFLLTTLTQPSSQHHPRTVEQLRTLLTRCVQELPAELAAKPDRVPVALRPRLPLAAHFPGPAAAAEALNDDFTLDARPFDALAPYRFRATCRSTRRPVIVQTLPPENLLPAECVSPGIDAILRKRKAGAPPRYLLEPVMREHAELIVEESCGQWTLESLVRARGHLEPGDTLAVLRQIDAACAEAESLGVPLHWGSPGQIAVAFTGGDDALPPTAKRARLPLAEWPAFTLKFRPWPVTLNFTQPERWLTDRLPAPAGRESAGAAALDATPRPQAQGVPPTARDLALLAAWMLGGAGQAPESVKPVLYDQLAHSGEATTDARAEFLDRFAQRLEPRQGRARRGGTAAAAAVPAFGGLAAGAATITLEEAERRTPSRSPRPVSAPGAQENDDDAPTVGFAEALFGGGGGGASPVAEKPSRHALYTPRPAPRDFDDDEYGEDDAPEVSPFSGFPEYTGDPYAAAEAEDEESVGGGWPMLLLVVILISAALAALVAHFSGMAVWL